jgi:hypothetical protein
MDTFFVDMNKPNNFDRNKNAAYLHIKAKSGCNANTPTPPLFFGKI